MSATRTHGLLRDPAFRADQAAIALCLAQLDDQSRRLERTIDGLDTAALERQPGPGRNSVGMLLAHIALTEVFWIGVADGSVTDREDAETSTRAAVGMGQADDGMPCPPGGAHPAVLAGWDLARHLDLLRRARTHLRSRAAQWTDTDLGTTVQYRDRVATREWILYHLVEHYAQHAGQIGLVLALAAKPV